MLDFAFLTVVDGRSMSSSPWLPATALLPPLPQAPQQHDWLLDQGSLTRRLTALSADQFQVQVVQEGWQSLRPDESTALGLPESSRGWVREVLLCGQHEPWVFARSVAGEQALKHSGLDLQRLGERPLGELLFCSPGFQRGPLELCFYPQDWLPLAQRHSGLWARRSCFQQAALGILVAEVFLPALWQQLEARV